MHVLRSNLDDTVRTYYYVSTSCHDKRQETAREHACRASQEPAAEPEAQYGTYRNTHYHYQTDKREPERTALYSGVVGSVGIQNCVLSKILVSS
jgi:hypothetical protein